MATVVWRKIPSRDFELLYSPALMRQMKETAYRVADYLKTDDEVAREDFAKALLITFIRVDEWKLRTSSITLESTIRCLDTTKDGFKGIFEHYAWFCGYDVVWSQESVVIESRFGA